jgi:hypothetical protein
MQRCVRAARATLLVAFLFPVLSFVSTYAAVWAPTPAAGPTRVSTAVPPRPKSTPRAAGNSTTLLDKVFMPFISRGEGSTHPKPLAKTKTGIHLGNHVLGDFPQDMLFPFSGDDPQGNWPKVIVAQSRQVFNIDRDEECKLINVLVANWNAYFLLRDAARHGSQVVIRIMPSPGNFAESITADWQDQPNRTMIESSWPYYRETPGGVSQCNMDGNFRTASDIGDEMLAIQLYTANDPNYWQVWGFEPANEPNIEWYRYGTDATFPALNQYSAWQDMDGYFSSIYEYVTRTVRERYPTLSMRVLTPPMSQSAYAERVSVQDCSYFLLQGSGASGYEAMGVFDAEDPFNDGYSWHNYFAQGKETYGPCPIGHHVSTAFSPNMNYWLDNHLLPGVITEADLADPDMGYGGSITDKDTNPTATFNSLNGFVTQETRAQAVAVWLLNDNNTGNPGTHSRHIWHEAYNTDTEPGRFRDWFWQWWDYSQ